MLVHLKYTECPVCAAKVKVRTQDGVPHSNGQLFETIEFRCVARNSVSGCIIQWSPNLCKEELIRGCPNAHELCIKLKLDAIGRTSCPDLT